MRPAATPSAGLAPAALPLAGRRIVVTRAEDDADAFADRLRALGAEPIVVPAIQTTPARGTDLLAAARGLDTAAPQAGSATWAVFTSATGVRYTVPALAWARPANLPPGLRVAAIGPATADALRLAGLPVHFVPAVHTAEALAAALPVAAGDRVVLFRADIGRPALPDALRARGVSVLDVVAYHTVPCADPPALARALDAGPDAVVFTSPSTVRGILAALPDPRRLARVSLVAIGPVTAREMEANGLAVAAVATPHTVAGLLSALVDLYPTTP